ncbi:MAG: AAA family ATPase [Planctomycetota bacterium]
MSSKSNLVAPFREALTHCKRLYIRAARAGLEDHPDADENTRRDLIRRMVDLHNGLLVKIYATVAMADSRWSDREQELARELVDHIWRKRLENEELQHVARRMFQDAGSLNWYSLVRPFDQVAGIRDMAADLETAVVRIANLVAKADGTVTAEEQNALRTIQNELEVHLRRISLGSDETDSRQGKQPGPGIIHQEQTLLGTSSESASRADKENQEAGLQQASDRELAEEMETANPTESLEQVLDDLTQLVGLEQIKQEINTLTNYLKLQQHRRAAGLPRHQLSLHMVFKGNPGTGKTTVARIVGRIFKALGLLRKGHLIETDRSGLVAEYAGQTATKTNKKIDEAMDGILFIDEAYSLVSTGREDAYGLEAVQALVKRMEDDRDRLVVILAGYPEPMQSLLESNPGLSSRFNTQMMFPDYNPVDLGRIYHRMCEANHYVVEPPARAKLLFGFDWLYGHRDEHFGNGRLVRNTFENSVRQLANRIVDVAPITRDLLTRLTSDDIHMKKVPQHVWKELREDDVLFAVHCDSCGKTIHVRCRHLGVRVRCPHCKCRLVADWGTPVEKPTGS